MREIKCERCATIVANIKYGSVRNDAAPLCAPCYNLIIGKVKDLEARIKNAERIVENAPPGFLQGLFSGKSKTYEDV